MSETNRNDEREKTQKYRDENDEKKIIEILGGKIEMSKEKTARRKNFINFFFN